MDVLNPASLVLRLRLLFGVGPRADIMSYLISRGSEGATIPRTSTITGYSRSRVHRIIEQLVEARITGKAEARPAEYFISPEAWRLVIGEGVLRKRPDRLRRLRYGIAAREEAERPIGPFWPCWIQVFSFLANIEAETNRALRDARGTEGIEVVDRQFRIRFGRLFYDHGLILAPSSGIRGRYIEELQRTISSVEAWCSKHA